MNRPWLILPLTLLLGASAALAQQRPPQSVEVLATRSGCFQCHAADKNKVGPSLREIAARYKGDPAARASLTAVVKNGGKGKWTNITGGVPMPAYAQRLSPSDIAQLVTWVLGR